MVAHTVIEYTTLEYTIAAAKHITSGYTMATSKQTVVVEQTTVVVVAMVQTVAEVVVVPPTYVFVVVLFDSLLHSHSALCPSSSLGANHMLEIPYPHSQQIDRTCNANLLDL